MLELRINIPQVPAAAYNIYIASGILDSVWSRLEADYPRLKKFVVTDAGVAAAGHLRRLLGDASPSTCIIDPPGETSKHIGTVTAIIEAMEKAFLGRDTLIVALGGGTVGDVAGFAAAIFKRGVPVVQIPTTTVAQADSSVGGKTGVDSTISKNAFGAFWQPAAVYIDVQTLATLDDRQYRAGLVESVKHALIADSEYFDWFETHMPAVLARDPAALEHIALKNCRIKGDVVEEDPTEKNRRRVLNFGHTIGHAVEAASGFQLLHGEAVGVGIVAAEIIADKLGLAAPERLPRIKNLLAALSIPLKIPAGLQKENLVDIMKRDKKAVDQWPRFVLLDDVGRVFCKDGRWAHEVDPRTVDEALDRLCR